MLNVERSLRFMSSRVREQSSSTWVGRSRVILPRIGPSRKIPSDGMVFPRLLRKRLRALRSSSHCSGRAEVVAEAGVKG